jgi:glycosyltransferase involved in cell wall biosynthesis
VLEVSPRITVLMPINRDDGFFESSLSSVLNQSYENFELIIIANNCDDSLWESILKITDSRVIARRSNIGGLALALNFGLSIARGEYIARMDADDICLPDRFKFQLSFLEQYKNIDILGGRAKIIDSLGVELSDSLCFFETHREIVSALPYRNPLVHPAVFIRKKVLIENGGYRFGFSGEDYELWIRLMLAGKIFHNLDKELLLYRRHVAQMTGDDKTNLIFSEVSAMLFMYFIKTGNIRFLIGIITKIPFFRRVRRFIQNI